MFKVNIKPQWEIRHGDKSTLDTGALLALLRAIEETGSIARATVAVGLSYRYAWGLLREAEKTFGASLMTTSRGRGTQLTPLAAKLMWADRRIAARLSPTLESLASELETELGRTASGSERTIRLDASHGFAVAALLLRLNEVSLPLELRYRNSTDAVVALARKECDLAGFHVPIGEFGPPASDHYRQWLNPKIHCLIHLALRNQGLFVAPGNPLGIRGLEDLARPEVRFVNRQTGSGTRMLLELMLARTAMSAMGINGFENAEFTHSAVAAYIASGMADVGIGVQTAAERFGLEFIPLLRERYMFALTTESLEDPLMHRVLAIIQSTSYREAVDSLPGYDGEDTGKILSLAEAFGAAPSGARTLPQDAAGSVAAAPPVKAKAGPQGASLAKARPSTRSPRRQ
ncbi:MAG: putative molybdenum-binding protein [Herminiimonas sp.]|nr:putative molybdenum-binding protein [Herminiimonas sp.]